MFDIPVLIIIFNRPEMTKKLIGALRLVKPKLVFVSADGARENVTEDVNNCEGARNIIGHIDWECKVEKLYHTKNQGCHWGPRKALSWFFKHVEEGIILEDDCIPNKDFFFFCKELLATYRYDERIISINGSNLGYNLKDKHSYTFSRFMNMWGWATWKRSAQKIDYSLKEWKNEKLPLWTLNSRLRQHLFDFDINWYKYWKHKFDITVTSKTITWWDWQWIFHQIKNKQLSVVPGKNLIQNIGFNEEGTHTHEKENPAANLQVKGLQFPLIHPDKMKVDFLYEENYVKEIWCCHKRMPVLLQLKIYISRVLGMHPKYQDFKN